ncbi:mannan-binding lectin serine protease 1 isoform X3 [Heterodontus francisci]|uniref:mannan-binding lectin serine protease 1 isoform X3 n=1 Tax=Heterodontus francisci TaxID=7792 RepID=UPI00355BB096
MRAVGEVGQSGMGCFWLFVLCLFSPGGANVTELAGMFGQIQSPNYPEGYPSDLDVTWNITVPTGFRIKLYFMHFDLEPSYLCEYDYVKVAADDDLLETFCGRESTDTEQIPGREFVLTNSNTMTITFRTDFSNEERFTGFEAHYSAVDIDECVEKLDEALFCDHYCHNYIGGFYCSCRFSYILHSDNRTCKVECSDNVFTEKSGVINSPDYPNSYPKSSDCLYRIELEEGFSISLEFADIFDLEDHPDVPCPYDYLKIKAGMQEFGPFCGDESPGRIDTNSSSVQILFHSDDSGDNRGWKIMFTSVGTPCPVVYPPANGTIEPVLDGYSFKDQVQIRCNIGFKFVKGGDEVEAYQIECEKSGMWSSSIPTCKAIDCGIPRSLQDGFITFYTKDNLTLFGSQIEYSCFAIFYRMETELNSTYTCMENGFWVNDELGTDLPICQPVCGRPTRSLPPLNKRIIGGRTAHPGSFPWQLLMMVEDMSRVPKDKWFGSGALLSRTWVLTAAHVLRSQRRENTITLVPSEYVTIYLGLHDVRQKEAAVKRTVEKIILHKAFDPRTYNNDIALVKMKDKVSMNVFVMPLCLPNLHQGTEGPQPNTLGLVAGWGITNPNMTMDEATGGDHATLSNILQYVKLPVTLQAECKSSYESRSDSYNVTNNMFCAGFYEECGRPRTQRSSIQPKIAQGRVVSKGSSPWIAMLSKNGIPFCGGSLVGDKWIITAAHCLHPPYDPDIPNLSNSDLINITSFKVILGRQKTLRKEGTEQVFRAKRIICHRSYNSSTFEFDIALLELPRKVTITDYVMPICLPENSIPTLHPGDMVIVSGWGKQFLHSIPETLMEVGAMPVREILGVQWWLWTKNQIAGSWQGRCRGETAAVRTTDTEFIPMSRKA